MADISTWSTVAAENNTASPDGFPEGMTAGGLNNSSREVMAAIARRRDAPDWVGYDDAPTYVSANSFTVAGDYTEIYQAARRCRVLDTDWIYGTISSSVYNAPNTLVTVARDTGSPVFTAGATEVEVGILKADPKPFLDNHLVGTFTGLRVERSNLWRVEIDADQVLVGGASGTIRVLGVDTYARLDQSGANGLDTGTEQPETWYYVYVIWGNGQTAGLFSAEFSNPTLPAGYTHAALVSAVYNDASSNLYNFSQRQREVSYRGGNYGVTASVTGGQWTQGTLAALIPSIAVGVRLALSGQGEMLGAAPYYVAGSGEVTGAGGIYSLQAISTNQRTFGGVLASGYHAVSGWMPWTGSGLFISETSTFSVQALGWDF